MSILPKNEKKETVDTPKNFFIYGATMSGKSYLAGEFPNPLFLDTDGNAKANPYPSIELRNVRNKSGEITRSIIEQLDEIILALETSQHTYETVVLDVIDDIVVMIEQAICNEAGVETLGDIGYGKGYAAFNSVFNQLVIDLKTLPMNVIYVSRISSYEEDNVRYEVPSLKEKHVNVVNGNCDYMIQTSKIGRNHVRQVRNKRKNYVKERIEDERIAKILSTITGAFERSKTMPKKEQDKVFEEKEKKVVQQVTHNEESGRKKPIVK
ncbi:AAA family ATPase [Hutsoniella sourekii]|uniref:AAA family ATPase n=1 Tax=Hutsoniella sourekii TaxID=87650 RepID=UPI0004B3DDDA|nr:AAA family ATPase [Hutsoniella sourekii]